MRKTCWLLVFVLLLGCFAGCQSVGLQARSIENADGTLSDWMRKEIEQKIAEQYDGSTVTWQDSANYGSVRYYGVHDGFVIIYLYVGGIDTPITKTIGGRTFRSGGPFHLLLYKGGEFVQLEDAYEQNIVDDEVVATIKAKHMECENWKKSDS